MTVESRTPSGARLIRFVLVGAGATLLLFVLAFLFRRAGMPAFAAGATGYAIAFVFAYAAQHGWTFGGNRPHREAFPRYLVAQSLCAALAGIVAHLCVALLQASAFWMSVAATITAAMASYLLSSRWVFAERR